jgi:DNA-binding CsgD family transcriptional regulator
VALTRATQCTACYSAVEISRDGSTLSTVKSDICRRESCYRHAVESSPNSGAAVSLDRPEPGLTAENGQKVDALSKRLQLPRGKSQLQLPRGAPQLQLGPGDAIAYLTTQERKVVEWLGQGRRPKEIAREWGISLATIRSHIRRAKQKTGARTLPELMAVGWRASPQAFSPPSGPPLDRADQGGLPIHTGLPEAHLRAVHDRYDLSGFLSVSPRRAVYLRLAAHASGDLAEILEAPADPLLIRAQIVTAVSVSPDFLGYIKERWPWALLDSAERDGLALAFAGTIVGAYLAGSRPPLRLSARQLEVQQLLANGLRQREIAARLGISDRQVQRLVADAVLRQGVRTTAELVAIISSMSSQGIVALIATPDDRRTDGADRRQSGHMDHGLRIHKSPAAPTRSRRSPPVR